MRTIYFFLFALSGLFFLPSCTNQVEETVTYKINEPVFMPASEFRNSVNISKVPQKIEVQGKIAFFNGFMYISEPEKGIHIVDNRDQEKPVKIGFIELLGNVDLAIKDNILYADSYIDLVWFDISSPSQPKFLGRKEDVFPTALPLTDNMYMIDYAQSMSKDKGIVVGWIVRERTETYMRNRNPWWDWALKSDAVTAPMSNSGSKGGVGLTGSMSRFAIYQGKYLYTVLNNYLGVFNIEKPTPEKMGDVPVGFNVETIFSYKNNMFMGTPTGMLIYSVDDPLKPAYQSSLQHVYGCDPVVVENDIAYVTVHSGNNCGQNNNQLIIIDVKDVKNPKAIVTYSMTKPKGLGIDNGTLFVCDDGLKIYDAKNPETLKANELAHFKSINGKEIDSYDLIAHENILMMIAANGIYQYNYSDLKNIKYLSTIPIGN